MSFQLRAQFTFALLLIVGTAPSARAAPDANASPNDPQACGLYELAMWMYRSAEQPSVQGQPAPTPTPITDQSFPPGSGDPTSAPDLTGKNSSTLNSAAYETGITAIQSTERTMPQVRPVELFQTMQKQLINEVSAKTGPPNGFCDGVDVYRTCSIANLFNGAKAGAPIDAGVLRTFIRCVSTAENAQRDTESAKKAIDHATREETPPTPGTPPPKRTTPNAAPARPTAPSAPITNPANVADTPDAPPVVSPAVAPAAPATDSPPHSAAPATS